MLNSLLVLCFGPLLVLAQGSHKLVEAKANPPAPVVGSMPPMPVQHDSGEPLTNLTVFVVPHSHDDTGWQRTVDEYYEEQVRYIYDTVVAALLQNPARRFIFVEVAFFMRWWREQGEGVRSSVRTLVDRGQIEFVNGGWCMADDASPSLDDQIDQLTRGHRYIADTLGVIPRYAWHIDPFGESSSYALAFAAMNYSAWVFNRIDTRLKDIWHNQSRLQFHWEPDNANAAGASTNPGIFAHVLDTHYGAPEITYKNTHYHFDFEYFGGLGGGADESGNAPFVEHDPSPFYAANAETAAEAFAAMARLRAAWFKLGGSHQPGMSAGSGAILVPFGDDMKFQNAHKQYSNMDRLIERVNERFDDLRVDVRYGTLDEYFRLLDTASATVASAAATTTTNSTDAADLWPTYGGDFFPLGTNNNIYSDQPTFPAPDKDNEYWTGHYSTRPLMKSLVAAAGHAKHTAEIASALACASETRHAALGCKNATPTFEMSMARDVTAVLEHHDSITGTSKQQVTADLDVRLRASIAASTAMLAGAIGPAGDIGLAGGPVCPFPAGSTPNATCHTVNVGQSVLLFNAMAQPRTEFIELSINPAAVASAHSFGVFYTPGAASQSKAVAVDAVVVPAVPGAFAGAQVEHNASSATLVFRAELPALSSGIFQLLPVANTSGGDSVAVQQASWDCAPPTSDVSIGFGSFTATFDMVTHRLKELRSGTASFPVNQAFAEYHATSKSNAYQFAPNCTSGFPSGEPLARGKAPALCTLSNNKVLRRAVQTYASPAVLRETSTVWATASSGAPDTAVLQTTTELVMNTAERELVTRYASDLDNTVQGHYFNSSETTDHLPVFETDDNGALMLRRVVNKTYWGKDEAVFHVTMPTAGNFYPLSGAPGAIRISAQSQPGSATDDTRALALVVDTAHGATSLRRGELEVMLGRRVAEKQSIAVNDTDAVRLHNWLVPSATRNACAEGQRLLQMRMSAPLLPVIWAGGTQPSARSSVPPASMPSSSSSSTPRLGGLPTNVQLLSLDRLGVETTPISLQTAVPGARVLLRLRHIFMHGESATMAVQATVDLRTLLPGARLTDVAELPLNGVGTQTRWDVATNVLLQPLQIRTFVATIELAA